MSNNQAKQIALKDKWFFIFAFLPFLQWIPYFMMNARVSSKKHIIYGAIYIFTFLVLLIVPYNMFFSKNIFRYYELNNFYIHGFPAILSIAMCIFCIFLILLFFVERPKYFKRISSQDKLYVSNVMFSIEFKYKWFLIFSFIPFLQWIPCFGTHKKVISNKGIMYGFFYLVVMFLTFLILYILFFDSNSFSSLVSLQNDLIKFKEKGLSLSLSFVLFLWVFYMAIDFFVLRYEYYKKLNYQKQNAGFPLRNTVEFHEVIISIFSFIPFVQWVSLFIMYSQNRSRKYLILGFLCFISYLLICIIPLSLFGFQLFNYFRFRTSYVVFPTLVFLWLLFFILIYFILYPKNHRSLLMESKKNQVMNAVTKKQVPDFSVQKKKEFVCEKCGSKLDSEGVFCGNCGYYNDKVKNTSNTPIKEKEDTTSKIDVNKATEDELTETLGLTVMEAKQVIAYRENNGSFINVDDFFNSFNAKPHIIVRVKDLIEVNIVHISKEKIHKQANKSPARDKSSRIDL